MSKIEFEKKLASSKLKNTHIGKGSVSKIFFKTEKTIVIAGR